LLSGAAEIYANHAVIIVGSTGPAAVTWGDGPVGADDHHVAIKTRGQIAHTRVCFWSHVMPLVGHEVFDGQLDLPDYKICVGDIEGLGRWTQRIGRAGVQRVVVRVDDPGRASRVNVGLDIGTHVAQVPDFEEPALMEVVASGPDMLSMPGQRGLILDGHDSPHARLTAAIRTLSASEPDDRGLERYEVGIIVEWLRWLGKDLSFDRAQTLGVELLEPIQAARAEATGGIAYERAKHLARRVLDQID
jgi:hypothetical protein